MDFPDFKKLMDRILKGGWLTNIANAEAKDISTYAVAGINGGTNAQKTLAERVDIVQRETKMVNVTKHVGPIWGQYEAAGKIGKWLAQNKTEMKDWKWTGHWNSENGTSYAHFEKTETL